MAFGPLGGQTAAEALCSVLANASDSHEIYRIANALARLAWAGAKDTLIETGCRLPKSSESGVHEAIGMALVKACGADEGFDLLFEHVQQSGDLAVENVEALDALDDPRAVPLMRVLVNRTRYKQNRTNAEKFLSRH